MNNIENSTNNNITKGYLYEKQIKDYIINHLDKPAYLWAETPETILIEAGIIGTHNELRLRRKENKLNPLRDTGVDVIQIENDNKISFIQCKNGYLHGLRMEDLAGFSLMALHHYGKIHKGYVYYTDKLSYNITSLPSNKKIEYIKKSFVLDNEDITKNKNILIKQNIIKPFDYQLEAKNKIIEYFKTNKRGILSLPCGTGKTLISYISSIKLSKQIIIISPLKQFAKQNLDRFVEYGFNSPTLLIDSDSDGTRNFNEIKKFIKSNEKFVISSTFCSVDIINKCLNYLNNPFIIVDEFHNLSKTNVSKYLNNNEHDNDEPDDDEPDDDEPDDDEPDDNEPEENTDDFYQILKSDSKILFVSATPRIYELEDDDNENYSEELFGEIIYKMSFDYAIKNNLICDYKIWLPSIHENNVQLKNELDIYKIDDVIKAKCIYLISCLLNTGSMKTIIYCVDTKEIKLFEEAIKKLDDYFVLDCEINKITSDTSNTNRIKILNNFTSNKSRQLLLSVRILDECVDIPSCDSIFITYPTKSKIRTIQRLNRATRLNPSNKFKKANIFLWCNQYDEILETLSGIKEYDEEFVDKIKINQVGFFTDKLNVDEEIIKDVKLVKDYSIGIKEYKCLSWEDKLNQVKDYIDLNGKRPTSCDKDEKIKNLGNWLSDQKKNYKKKIKIMRNQQIRTSWENFISSKKYGSYFTSNEEEWMKNLNNVKKYIDENNKKPSGCDENDSNNKLSKWISHQQQNYKKQNRIMSREHIRKMWDDFVNSEKYKKYFVNNEEEKWIENLNSVKKYIDDNGKKPSIVDDNEQIKKLSMWIQRQNSKFNKQIEIMKNEKIRNMWNNLVNSKQYNKYFLSNEETWINNLNEAKKYINENNKRPSEDSKDNDVNKLGKWISCQIKNYKNKVQIMNVEQYRNEWENFVNSNEYRKYFMSNIEVWENNLNLVKNYIDVNKKKPSTTDDDYNIKKLGYWIGTQKGNYNKRNEIMKNEEIRAKWKNFIESDIYSKYFK